MAIPNLWRTKKQRYSLQGDVCTHCERAIFPPRQICPHCRRPMQASVTPTLVVFDFNALLSAPVAQPAMVGDD